MPDVRLIPLTKGLYTLVDASDFESLRVYKWQAQLHRGYTHYAIRSVYDPATQKTDKVLMHRQLLGFPPISVDHENRDGLDNRRINLREAGQSKNAANQKLRSTNSSGFVGVSYFSRYNLRKPWTAKVMVFGVSRNLGYFETAEEAARARDKASRKYFGEFARLNFPEETK